MSTIQAINAREILDSRGNPTVQADIITNKVVTSAIVPSGASTGIHEAHELRDKGKRYGGKGVAKAVRNINQIISKKLKGRKCTDQEKIDALLIALDGTEHKSKLGANALLAVSMAVCRAGAFHGNKALYEHIATISGSKRYSLPLPQMNIINGGKHAGMDNDIQEHMIMPTGFRSFSEALRAGTETYHILKKILKKKYGPQATLLGDEGGFAPQIAKVETRLELIHKAIKEAGYAGKIKLALDCASSEFYNKNKYTIGSKKYSSGQLVDVYKSLISKYKIISIEDGMAEDDWEGWQELHATLGKKINLVGDDLLVTNVTRMQTAIAKKACNALLLKVNQIGTVTEAIDAAKLAFKQKWDVVVSHRSGESEDHFIADLVVGLGASQSKFGAPARSDRTSKYNRLLAIEEQLSGK